jgi:2-oxoglutarate ferredoxin oxidoreductase subunit delta
VLGGINRLAVSQQTKSAYILIDVERCKGCKFCISVCPREIIGLETHLNANGYTPAMVKPEKANECTGCTSCAVMCPDAAITIYRHRPTGEQPPSLLVPSPFMGEGQGEGELIIYTTCY